ncbi:hypothetical protein Taro_048621 [Colocasia esculenta]|uniref:Uncharacterized protein n=1 Tax=Colocasia esculenta TaxID=4460 RepID=A0A843X8M5_COLES|nr:hypothetical protein [Colocasia esculenta]
MSRVGSWSFDAKIPLPAPLLPPSTPPWQSFEKLPRRDLGRIGFSQAREAKRRMMTATTEARLGAARAPGGNGSGGGRDGREVVDHLLGVAYPDADFIATNFQRYATHAVESILERGRLPIVAGGSNSFIGALVDGNDGEFRRRYDCCFLCVDVELTELDTFVSQQVDYMVEAGLVEEVRGAFR